MKQLTTNLLLFVAFSAMAGCASEDNTPQPDIKGMTQFSMIEETPSAQAAQSRTAGKYTGSKLKFYWTENDHLWLNTGSDLQKSHYSNIGDQISSSGGTTTMVPTATFYFNGTYTNPSYMLRYTGKEGVKDKVTIAPVQTQKLPADASQIGECGDCGVATATKNGDHYDFTLQHKAAYFTLIPFTSDSKLVGCKVTKIKITANEPLSGTFSFSDSGLDLATMPQTPSNSIILNLQGSDGKGFTLSSAVAPASNSATFVLPPKTYNTFNIEYTVTHPERQVSGTITEHYTNKTFHEGKNTRFPADIKNVVFPVHYLFSDGTTGLLDEAAGRTPIGVVIIEKQGTTPGTAIALKDAVSKDPTSGGGPATSRWGDGSNVAKSSDFNTIYNDMNGFNYTWNPNASIGNIVKGTTSTCYAFYTAAEYNPGVAITGANISKWYLPAAGEFFKAVELLGQAQKATTVDFSTSYTLNWNQMNSYFTAAGGNALDAYWYHTSSEVSITKSVTITFDTNGMIPPGNQYNVTDMDDKGAELVRPFVHF